MTRLKNKCDKDVHFSGIYVIFINITILYYIRILEKVYPNVQRFSPLCF